MTRLVTIQCRGCENIASFASAFKPNEEVELEEVQDHMDIFYKARCGSCFDCDWEVLRTKVTERGNRDQLYPIEDY